MSRAISAGPNPLCGVAHTTIYFSLPGEKTSAPRAPRWGENLYRGQPPHPPRCARHPLPRCRRGATTHFAQSASPAPRDRGDRTPRVPRGTRAEDRLRASRVRVAPPSGKFRPFSRTRRSGCRPLRLRAGGEQSLDVPVASQFYLEQLGAAPINAKSSLLPGKFVPVLQLA
jgi:hypothetical protein